MKEALLPIFTNDIAESVQSHSTLRKQIDPNFQFNFVLQILQ